MRCELQKQDPDKVFYFPDTEPVCKDMKLITLEKIRDVLRTGENALQAEEGSASRAREPLERMLALAAKQEKGVE